MKRYRSRGNILVTALFVAVFLFFLSTALLLSNRQDIALALSMEHKLKAESAARSAAAEAYGQLRQHGEFRGLSGKGGSRGVESRVQLIELPATGRRGKLVRVHCRATSGPVSSYMTYHLLKTPFLESESASGKVMLLPQGDEKALGIFGNGVLSELSSKLPQGMVAYGGPAFVAAAATTQSQVAFRDKIPVFPESGSSLSVIDPALVMAPTASDETVISRLDYKGNTFSWTPIPLPEGLGTASPDIEDRPLIFQAEASGAWNSLAVAGRGEELSNFSWYDSEPDTLSVEEAQGLTRSPVVSAVSAREGAAGMPSSSWYLTRGAIAASGSDLYTHAWHYLYRPHQGGVPERISAISGSRLTRWPCILRYSSEGGWTKVWGALSEEGSVDSPLIPDPSRLWATSTGKLYGLTGGSERRLMIFEKGKVKLGDGVVAPGELTLYRDELFVKRAESSELVSLEGATRIGLGGLPTGIPGIEGEMFDFAPDLSESFGIDEAGVLDTSAEGALELPPRKLFTVFPNYLLTYSMASAPVADKENLFVSLQIEVEGVDGVGELWDAELAGDHLPLRGAALARFGDESWQVQPTGLRYFLLRNLLDPQPKGQSAPPRQAGEDVMVPPGFSSAVVATYEGLPPNSARYSIVSIDTRPFEFRDETP